MEQTLHSRAPRAPRRPYTIGQLCREFDTTPRALRFYEEKGLLEPGRHNSVRAYSHKDRARLQLVLRGRKVGLSLKQIGEILDLYEPGATLEAQEELALQVFRARLASLEQIRRETDAAIRTLADASARLEAKAPARPTQFAISRRAS